MSIEEGDGKAREFGVMFIETSAKAGFNIKVERQITLWIFLIKKQRIQKFLIQLKGRYVPCWLVPYTDTYCLLADSCLSSGHFSIDSSWLNSSFYWSRQIWHPNSILQLQPLFRKIAAALPGMEALSSTKQEDMVDVNLKPNVNSSSMEQQGGGCPC